MWKNTTEGCKSRFGRCRRNFDVIGGIKYRRYTSQCRVSVSVSLVLRTGETQVVAVTTGRLTLLGDESSTPLVGDWSVTGHSIDGSCATLEFPGPVDFKRAGGVVAVEAHQRYRWGVLGCGALEAADPWQGSRLPIGSCWVERPLKDEFSTAEQSMLGLGLVFAAPGKGNGPVVALWIGAMNQEEVVTFQLPLDGFRDAFFRSCEGPSSPRLQDYGSDPFLSLFSFPRLRSGTA